LPCFPFRTKNRQIHWLSFLPKSAYQKISFYIQASWIATYMVQSCTHSSFPCLSYRTKNKHIHWLPFLQKSAYQVLFHHIQAPWIATSMIQSCTHSFLPCLPSMIKNRQIHWLLFFARNCLPETISLYPGSLDSHMHHLKLHSPSCLLFSLGNKKEEKSIHYYFGHIPQNASLYNWKLQTIALAFALSQNF